MELPYTLPQDFTLFILFKEKNIETWKYKLDWIAEHGGMALINIHPDYMNFSGAKPGYEEYPAAITKKFLDYVQFRYEGQYWHALPKEVSGFCYERLFGRTLNSKVRNDENHGQIKKVFGAIRFQGGIEMQLRPAVILSGHTTALGVIRSLGMMGVPIINVYYQRQDMGQVSKYVSQRVFAPHPEKNEEQFIRLLLNLSSKGEKKILIPADDATLSAVSRHMGALEDRYLMACTSWQVAEQFIDKKHTYALAERIGVPAPKTLIPLCEEDVKEFASRVDYPCLVKPRQSHLYFEVFRKKMVKVETYPGDARCLSRGGRRRDSRSCTGVCSR